MRKEQMNWEYPNNYKTDEDTIEMCRKAAEQGDPYAQNSLAVCYSIGQGVEQSYAEAVKWFRKAAEQGSANAQFNLGLCYDNGDGVEQSYAEAVKWYRKAAEQDDAHSQFNLGICYLVGNGVDQSDTEAVKWFSKAANQGLVEAQYNLGVDYRDGKGVEQSDTEAVKWFSKAANQGLAEAQNELGCYYAIGRCVEQSYSEAAEWYRKAADQGYPVAQCNLGHCYKNGDGVEQSGAEAMKWFRKAADQGYAKALVMLESEIDIEYIPMPKEVGPKAIESKTQTFVVSECLVQWLKVDYDQDSLNSSEYSQDDQLRIDCDEDSRFDLNDEFQEFLDKVYAECYFHPTKGHDILQQKEKIWLVRDLGESYYRPQKSFGDFKREEQLPLIGTSLLHFDEEKCWNRYLDSLLPEYRKFFENLSDEERYNRYQITYYDWNPTRVYDWKAIDIRPKNI